MLKMNKKRPAENNTDEKPCKRARTEEVVVCAICKDPDSPEPFTFLVCAHSFHTICITPWLERSCSCPICRTVVRESTASVHDCELDETDFSLSDASEINWSDSFATTSSSSLSSSLSLSSSSSSISLESDSDETSSQSDFDENFQSPGHLEEDLLSQSDFEETGLLSQPDFGETGWSEVSCDEADFCENNFSETDYNEENYDFSETDTDYDEEE